MTQMALEDAECPAAAARLLHAERATFDALKHQDSPRSVAARRSIKVSTLQARSQGADSEVVAD